MSTVDVVDVVVVGSINQDTTVLTARLPSPGETVLGRDHYTAGGGKGANQAVAAARLGSDVALIGRVGSDQHGTALRAALTIEGIDAHEPFPVAIVKPGEAAMVASINGTGDTDTGSSSNSQATFTQGQVCMEDGTCFELNKLDQNVNLAETTGANGGQMTSANAYSLTMLSNYMKQNPNADPAVADAITRHATSERPAQALQTRRGLTCRWGSGRGLTEASAPGES